MEFHVVAAMNKCAHGADINCRRACEIHKHGILEHCDDTQTLHRQKQHNQDETKPTLEINLRNPYL